VSAGRLVAIYVTPTAGAPMEARDAVDATAGGGLTGDRYGAAVGTYSGQRRPDHERGVTLIAAEAVAAAAAEAQIPLDPSETRRNLVVAGIDPADLDAGVGRELRVGPVVLRGTDLADPCTHLERLTRPGVRVALLGRGGLRCEIVTGGRLTVGDAVMLPR
jgi:MOSC domain-containing protein YiiM